MLKLVKLMPHVVAFDVDHVDGFPGDVILLLILMPHPLRKLQLVLQRLMREQVEEDEHDGDCAKKVGQCAIIIIGVHIQRKREIGAFSPDDFGYSIVTKAVSTPLKNTSP